MSASAQLTRGGAEVQQRLASRQEVVLPIELDQLEGCSGAVPAQEQGVASLQLR